MISKLLYLYCISLALLSQVSCDFQQRRILYGRCYEETNMPHAIYMDCANSGGSCEVRKGSSHTLQAIFRPSVNSSSVDSYVVWKNGWLPVPLPNQERNACLTSIVCPLKANELTAYRYNLAIDGFWPQGEYPVQWTLTDSDTDEEVVCFKFKVLIT